MLVLLPAHHDQLVLGECRVEVGQGHAVEARSKAASSQGYSHLSGIEIMSNPFKLRHLAFRPVFALGRRFGLARIGVLPPGNGVVVHCLPHNRPTHACRSTSASSALAPAGACREVSQSTLVGTSRVAMARPVLGQRLA